MSLLEVQDKFKKSEKQQMLNIMSLILDLFIVNFVHFENIKITGFN